MGDYEKGGIRESKGKSLRLIVYTVVSVRTLSMFAFAMGHLSSLGEDSVSVY